MPPPIAGQTMFTLPQIAEACNADYRTLRSWLDAGLFKPSIRRSEGTGMADLFSQSDRERIAYLVKLRRAGLSTNGLREANADPNGLIHLLTAYRNWMYEEAEREWAASHAA